ncbi:MAG: hypothetical protein JRI62_08315 [Deltaproteobacteria bacterium]|nr:hypothetical protein [Deltaproteobacteria bacterium]
MVKKQRLSKHSGKSRKIHELLRYKIFKQPSDLKTATQQLAGVDSKGIVVLTVTIINHENEILGNFTVISPSRIRIRKI